MTYRILILGGTTEARELAGGLAGQEGLSVVLSLAGRTERPARQPAPVRVGGFGGAEGLARHLGDERIDLLVDATHPYAARISANAVVASRAAGVPLLALRRPAWEQVEGDVWTEVENVGAAVVALGPSPRRVFLALGRQEVGPFENAPQHDYLIRSVDPIEPPLAVPYATYLLGRGPFPEAEERALLMERCIDAIVAKNSGGAATYGKIAAARALGIEVVLIRRPDLPEAETVETVDEALANILHRPGIPSERGE